MNLLDAIKSRANQKRVDAFEGLKKELHGWVQKIVQNEVMAQVSDLQNEIHVIQDEFDSDIINEISSTVQDLQYELHELFQKVENMNQLDAEEISNRIDNMESTFCDIGQTLTRGF